MTPGVKLFMLPKIPQARSQRHSEDNPDQRPEALKLKNKARGQRFSSDTADGINKATPVWQPPHLGRIASMTDGGVACNKLCARLYGVQVFLEYSRMLFNYFRQQKPRPEAKPPQSYTPQQPTAAKTLCPRGVLEDSCSKVPLGRTCNMC